MAAGAKRKPACSPQQTARKRGGGGAGEGLRSGLEEAVRHCRGIAGALDAEGFGLVVSASAGERPLAPVFDCDFPIPSPYLTAFLAVHDAEVARHLLASSAPLWWGGGQGSAECLAGLPWAARLAPHGGVVPGIAFPCYPERGPHGLVLFWGRRLGLDPGTAADIHARCFALYEAVALVRAEGEARRPQMSRRELECLELTAQGQTSEDIAKALGLSVHTTNQHLSYAAQKLNAVNRIHTVAKALRLRLIE